MCRSSILALATHSLPLAIMIGVLLLPMGVRWPVLLASGTDPDPLRQAPPGALLLPGDPPAVGVVVVQDPLTGPGRVYEIRCLTGLNTATFVEEGYLFKVSGPCFDESTVAAVHTFPLDGLIVPDGEIRLQAKILDGYDRAGLMLSVREAPDFSDSYLTAVIPSPGIARLGAPAQSESVVLAAREDLTGRCRERDWFEVAVRLHGPNIWVLLNDEPVLSASDPTLTSGQVSFGFFRTGEIDDRDEVAAVVRNLRVSRLAS